MATKKLIKMDVVELCIISYCCSFIIRSIIYPAVFLLLQVIQDIRLVIRKYLRW